MEAYGYDTRSCSDKAYVDFAADKGRRTGEETARTMH